MFFKVEIYLFKCIINVFIPKQSLKIVNSSRKHVSYVKMFIQFYPLGDTLLNCTLNFLLKLRTFSKLIRLKCALINLMYSINHSENIAMFSSYEIGMNGINVFIMCCNHITSIWSNLQTFNLSFNLEITPEFGF